MAIIKKSAQATQEKETGVLQSKEIIKHINGEPVVVAVVNEYKPEKGQTVFYLRLWNGKIGRAWFNKLQNHVVEEVDDEDIVFDD